MNAPPVAVNSTVACLYPLLCPQLPAHFSDALVGRTMCLVYKARSLISQFPFRASQAPVDLMSFAQALGSSYAPALPPMFRHFPSQVGTMGFFLGQTCIAGAYAPLDRQLRIPDKVSNRLAYAKAVGAVVHEQTHVDQFFPLEIREFVPDIDTVHARVNAIIDEARAGELFVPLKEEARKDRYLDLIRLFEQQSVTSIANLLKLVDDYPNEDIAVLLKQAARVLPGMGPTDQMLIYMTIIEAEQTGLLARSLFPDQESRTSIEDGITTISARHFPELHSALVHNRLNVGKAKTESRVATILLARAMVALLNTPDNRSRATAIFVRTLNSWLAYLNSLVEDSFQRIFEVEAEIVEALSRCEPDKIIARLRTDHAPYANISLPERLQVAGGIMAMFSGSSPDSDEFLKTYREQASLIGVLGTWPG